MDISSWNCDYGTGKRLKALSAPPMSYALYSKLRNPSFEKEEREFWYLQEFMDEIPSPQNGSPVRVTDFPWGREAIFRKNKGVPRERAWSQDAENGSYSSDGSMTEPLDPWKRSATRKKQKRTRTGFLEEWIRSHPVLTLALLALLLLLAVVFGVSLAVCSGRRQTEIPVTFDIPLLLACPKGWVGYRGSCYFFSRDHCTWDQAQARCLDLGASLAMPKDMDMRFLSCLSGNIDQWLGLRRQGRWLQWVDGSRFSSSVEVVGNGECVFLDNDKFWSGSCSNPRPYLCSKPQSTL